MDFEKDVMILGVETHKGKKDINKSYTFISLLAGTSSIKCLYTGNEALPELKYLQKAKCNFNLVQRSGFLNLSISRLAV